MMAKKGKRRPIATARNDDFNRILLPSKLSHQNKQHTANTIYIHIFLAQKELAAVAYMFASLWCIYHCIPPAVILIVEAKQLVTTATCLGLHTARKSKTSCYITWIKML
jgi:hypothetical protein